METIEIGAVKLDQNYEVVSELQVYVRSVLEPILSDLCKQITGIRQEQVGAGVGFKEAFAQFKEWADPPVRLVSWGQFDVTGNHVNLRKLFEKRYGHDNGYSKMEVAMNAVGLGITRNR